MNAAVSPSLAALPTDLVWKAGSLAAPAERGWPTGFAALDAELPGGGWPRGTIIELLGARPGIGELALLMPLLCRAPAQRWIAWVSPPWLPYAPALAAGGLVLSQQLFIDAGDSARMLWATRQAVASGACHAVLAWTERIDGAALRRLQLATEQSQTPLFLFRPASAARQPSPASLRLQLMPADDFLGILILKRRGPAAAAVLHLPIRRANASGYRHVLDSTDPARPAAAGVHAGQR